MTKRVTQRKRNAIQIGKCSDRVGRNQDYSKEPTQQRKKSGTLWDMRTCDPLGTWKGSSRLQLKSIYCGIKHFLYMGQFPSPLQKILLSSAICPECYYWQFFLQLPVKDGSKVTLPLLYKLELLCLLPKSHWINFLPYLIRSSSLNKVCYFPWLIFSVLDLHNAVPALFFFSG